MKFNILYIFWLIALCACIWLFQNIFGESETTFFGTAENEGIVLNYDHTVLVKRVFVKNGAMVKKGDTLAIFYRTELDRQTIDKKNEIASIELENSARFKEKEFEIKNLEAKKSTLQLGLNHEQQLLASESNIQRELLNLIDKNQSATGSNIKSERIRTLKEQITALEQQINVQKTGIKQNQEADKTIANQKIAHVGQELNFIESERKKLILLAPMTGFVEQVFITENTIEPQLKPLVKLNPTGTNRVKGFIYETAEISCRLGDTVQMSSVGRPNIITTGHFIGVSPEMVELPIRLRKSPEIRSWGREVYVQLAPDNNFYIGEKIKIKLNAKQ
ncbi:MAG: HlyD family secretion protein [Saprospiraceae bacterium]